MDISQAEYITIDKHPFLRLIIDGKEALIGDFKWSILELGLVQLRSRNPLVDWETSLPKIQIPDTKETDPFEFKGYTNNPAIIEMAHEFWKAINYLEGKKFNNGPVPIPKIT